jgi:Tol biopolymer transport system component
VSHRTVQLASKEVSTWSVSGLTARWSPTGERLAIMSDPGDRITIIDTAGTVLRTIDTPLDEEGWRGFGHQFDWSPDGKWLIVYNNTRMNLFGVDTGVILPLAWSREVVQAAWHR